MFGNYAAKVWKCSAELFLQQFQKNSAESWKYICKIMGEISLNFKNKSAECLEIMLQKNGNILQNFEQYCRISVIILQNIGNSSAEVPNEFWRILEMTAELWRKVRLMSEIILQNYFTNVWKCSAESLITLQSNNAAEYCK